MNIGGISGALVKAQAENHVSLISLNADISLFRVQPPSEYLAIGSLLSPQRKEEADAGQPHATAAKLGLLFDGLVPAIPHLIHAYGLRCSETAKLPLFNPKGGQEHGLFASQVGADGTSIWAAATSGKSAIAVHLLACMLRIWDSPKAISIWMELITVRKQELATSDNAIGISASRVELSRDELALWDASARSWCLTADQANERQQKQLRLIIDHLGLPVSAKSELSANVIDAWQTAMVMVDKLVAGEPQSAQSGAPLLGLASWHLYPDLVVLGKGRETKDVKQKDQLIHPGGILTLGIEDTRRSGQGIYWSLPLAHLRYYGDPVLCEVSLHSSTSRVSVEQLMFVALGSFIRRWLSDVDDIVLAATLLFELCDYIGFWDANASHSSWLSLFAHLAKTFLTSTSDRRVDLLRLIKCGRRRYPQFLDHPSTHSILGLSDPSTLLSLLPDSTSRTRLLRVVADDFVDPNATFKEGRHLMIIQCRDSKSLQWELFSARELPSTGSHIRWTNKMSPPQESNNVVLELIPRIPEFQSSQPCIWQDAPALFYHFFLERVYPPQLYLRPRGASVRVQFLFGDPRSAALYSIEITTWQHSPNIDPQTFFNDHTRQLPNIFVLPHVLTALRMRLPDPNALSVHLGLMRISKERDDWESSQSLLVGLKALLTLNAIYQSLPGATVELKAATQPLSSHKWLSTDLRSQLVVPWGPFLLTQEQTFACIAKFESGDFNFQPSAMRGVLAISSGNSLYVARCLLQDPCQQNSTFSIARVVGTVGKSGMAMLIPPQLPRIRRAADDYALVNHDVFDGSLADSFKQTTLHMTFTEWRLAIDVGSRGNRDVEAYYVETAIGVYDHGKWVADVNIMDVFSHALCNIMQECHIRHDNTLTHQDLGKLVAIDNWDELIDSPPEVAVVHTHGNWQARLAAAALSLQSGHETRILPKISCWTCCAERPLAPQPIRSHAQNDLENTHDETSGSMRKHRHDDDSDSDLDEIVEKELNRSKRRKVYEDLDEEREGVKGQHAHQNLIYIL